MTPHQSYVVDVLLRLAEGPSIGTKSHQDIPSGIQPAKEGEKERMEVVPVVLSCIHDISHIRIFLPKDIQAADARTGVKKSMNEIQRRFPDGLPLLDPIENMNIKDDSFKKLLRVRDDPVSNIRFTLLTRSRKSRFLILVF